MSAHAFRSTVDSRTTDKLHLLAIACENVSKSDPELTKRLKSFTLDWKMVEGIAVPFVKAEFYE